MKKLIKKRELIYRKGNRARFLPGYQKKISSLCNINYEKIVFYDPEKTDEVFYFFQNNFPKLDRNMVTLCSSELNSVISAMRKIENPYFIFLDNEWIFCGSFILPTLALMKENFSFNKHLHSCITLISVDLTHEVCIDNYEDRGVFYIDITEASSNDKSGSVDSILANYSSIVRTVKFNNPLLGKELSVGEFSDLTEDEINNFIPNNFNGKSDFIKFYLINNGGFLLSESSSSRIVVFFNKKRFCNKENQQKNNLFPVGKFLAISARSGDPASYRHTINKIWEINKRISKKMDLYCQSHFPFAGDKKGNYYWIDMNTGHVKYLIAKPEADPDNTITVASTFYDFCINLHSQY